MDGKFKEVVLSSDPPLEPWVRAAVLTHMGWSEDSEVSLDEVTEAAEAVRGLKVGYNQPKPGAK